MELERDYTLVLPSAGDGVQSCRIRIFGRDGSGDLPVVVCSFVPEERAPRDDDPASEAPDALAPERVAAEVMIANRLDEFVWVSHEEVGEGSFYLVVFAHYDVRGIVREDGVWRREIGTPTLKPLDRRSIESLVGISP